MLTEFRVENFKCFGAEVTLPMSRITLLTGSNSTGKSTALQPILCLHQAGVTLPLRRLHLNGPYVALGNYSEVRSRARSASDPMRLTLTFENLSRTIITELSLTQSDAAARWAAISKIAIEEVSNGEPKPLATWSADGAIDDDDIQRHVNVFLMSGLAEIHNLHYVSASRLGPQDYYRRSDRSDQLGVGVQGETTAEMLYRAHQEQTIVDEEMQVEGAPTITVVDQASAWLSYIFGGGAIKVASPLTPILTLEMNSDGSAHYVRPINLGFGYSYALPIIVAALVAKPGSKVIVENPEAHLHPSAQSRLGELLCRLAAQNVQVFVESHSEHILNSIRLAVKRETLLPDDVSILYFTSQRDPVVRVPVDVDGKVPFWPDGFFDQRTRELLELSGTKL